MFPNNNYKRARPRYRPINPLDTVATTGNLVNPVGSIVPVFTDPASASYGGQGLFGSGLPKVNTGASGNLPGYYGTAGTPVNQRFSSPTTGFIKYGNPFEQYQYKPPNQALTTASQMVGRRFGVNVTGNETNPNAPKPGTLPTGSFNPQQVLQAVTERLANGSTEPLNAADAEALGLTQVLNDPNSGWVKNDKGQYVNQAAPTATQGATPFGANAQGQRLDASGNVWDPTTATRDIYGHAFKGSGVTSPEDARQARKKYWENFNKQKRKTRKQPGAQQPTQTESGFVGNFGVVNFNTDSG